MKQNNPKVLYLTYFYLKAELYLSPQIHVKCAPKNVILK